MSEIEQAMAEKIPDSTSHRPPKAPFEPASHGMRCGYDVLDAAVRRARSLLSERLVAAYALGSLAHGGFASAVSDVHVALILSELDDQVPMRIVSIKRAVVLGLETFYQSAAAEAAQRLVEKYPWASPRRTEFRGLSRALDKRKRGPSAEGG